MQFQRSQPVHSRCEKFIPILSIALVKYEATDVECRSAHVDEHVKAWVAECRASVADCLAATSGTTSMAMPASNVGWRSWFSAWAIESHVSASASYDSAHAVRAARRKRPRIASSSYPADGIPKFSAHRGSKRPYVWRSAVLKRGRASR